MEDISALKFTTLFVISGIRIIRKTKVRKKRLMIKGERNSLKIYRFIMDKGFISTENIR
jgi:hypothetical protein